MMGILHGIFPRKIGVLHNICCINDIFNSLKNVEKKTKGKSRWCTSNQTKAESHTEPGEGLRLTFNKPVSSVYSLLGVTWS